MILMAKYLISLLLLGVISCGEKEQISASGLIEKTINAHGWQGEKPAAIAFDFRDHHYEILRGKEGVTYSRLGIKEGDTILDTWKNFRNFERFVNQKPVVVSDSMRLLYEASINSVAYFAQLPLGLSDTAVLPKYTGETLIKGVSYHSLQVAFKKEGGGTDFEDLFYYWIHPQHFTIDFMAYSYHTNEGGTRFRVANNTQRIGGILFQDYDNYRPEHQSTPLDSLPYLWEMQQLSLLSKIQNLNIRVATH
jgi:hypothetical protein